MKVEGPNTDKGRGGVCAERGMGTSVQDGKTEQSTKFVEGEGEIGVCRVGEENTCGSTYMERRKDNKPVLERKGRSEKCLKVNVDDYYCSDDMH